MEKAWQHKPLNYGENAFEAVLSEKLLTRITKKEQQFRYLEITKIPPNLVELVVVVAFNKIGNNELTKIFGLTDFVMLFV